MQRARQLTKRALVRIGRTALLRPMGRVALRLHKLSGRALKATSAEDMQNPAQTLDLQGLVEIATIDDAVERSLLGEKKPSPFLVPAIRTVWGYGFRHTADEHPWIAHLKGTDGELERFYGRYRPADILEAFAPPPRPTGETEPESGGFLATEMSPTPWLHSSRFGSAWGIEYGHKHRGPRSQEKVIATSEALFRVRDSLNQNGYRPDIGGWIRGYFLVHGAEFLFLICGGQHRSAAWVALGNETIPVIFQPKYPRLVDVDRLGAKSREVALCYFNDQYRKARRQLVRNL